MTQHYARTLVQRRSHSARITRHEARFHTRQDASLEGIDGQRPPARRPGPTAPFVSPHVCRTHVSQRASLRAKLTRMSPKASDVLAQALQLSEDERRELALDLFDSVGDVSADVDVAWLDEARMRIADVDAGRVTTLPNDDAWKLIASDD